MLPDSLKGRFSHSTTIVHSDSTHKRLIHFGGLDEWPEDPGHASTWQPVAETSIVELGEWSASHSHCCYGIDFIQFVHLTVECVLCAPSVDFSTRNVTIPGVPEHNSARGVLSVMDILAQ